MSVAKDILEVAAGNKDLKISLDRDTMIMLGVIVLVAMLAGSFLGTMAANKFS